MRATRIAAGAALVAALGLASAGLVTGAAPHTGLTAAAEVARAYDAVLDADFDRIPQILDRTCGPAPEVACLGLRALAAWWELQLDPTSRSLDQRFAREVERALTAAAAWTQAEPERAEAWFYLGAALGVRGQWKIMRGERLSAARDGKRIKEALERALALDPAMRDAEFGIGVYRYYAGVAPATLRWLRWLLLLPGGNRTEGLAQMERARRDATLVGAEAAYQVHVAYLWYERRAPDALAIILELQQRFPHNPLFRQIEAAIRADYLRDPAGSLLASRALAAAAADGAVHRAPLASVRARVNIAVQLDRLGRRDEARATIDQLLADAPAAPGDAIARARVLQRSWRAR